jgi:hypothetical protein
LYHRTEGQPFQSKKLRQLLRTGRGLRLGDARPTVEKMYGTRAVRDHDMKQERLRFCWEDDTWLEFTFDRMDKVIGIVLLGSVE